VKTDPGVKKTARAFVMNARDAEEMPDVITGTHLINNIYAKVLFDSGANQVLLIINFVSY
jgi:hypothetical protein